jgi:hypothetical protein
MYGFNENAGYVSSPPKKYLKSSSTGSYEAGGQFNNVSMLGISEISAVDGSFVSMYECVLNGSPTGQFFDRSWMVPFGNSSVTDPAFIINSTTIQWVPRPGPASSIPPGAWPKPSDKSLDNNVTSWTIGSLSYWAASELIETLYDENTEDTAFEAMLHTWSEYSETLDDARHEDRGSGFEFYYKKVEAYVLTPVGGVSGTANHGFTLTISTEERDYGTSDPWITSTPITLSTTSDNTGKINVVGIALTCDRGKERRITGVVCS